MSELEELKAKVVRLEALTDALLRTLWHERGEMKGTVGKIEIELAPFFQEWKERDKLKQISRKVEDV